GARRWSPAGVAWRARAQALHVAWSRRQVSHEQIAAAALAPSPTGQRGFPSTLPPGTAARVPAETKTAILAAAARLLRGEWDVLRVALTDFADPHSFHHP